MKSNRPIILILFLAVAAIAVWKISSVKHSSASTNSEASTSSAQGATSAAPARLQCRLRR